MFVELRRRVVGYILDYGNNCGVLFADIKSATEYASENMMIITNIQKGNL